MKKLNISPNLDVFSTRKNRVLPRYCSIRIDNHAFARDGLQINWNNITPWLHPPIPLINRCLNKVIEEKV
jgi:hypothetical protein